MGTSGSGLGSNGGSNGASNGSSNGSAHGAGAPLDAGLDDHDDHDDQDDGPDEPAPGDAPPALLEPAPERILELAASAVRFVQQRYGVGLDFTQDTLSLLDQYVRDARTAVGERPESLELVATSVGAYFGEVVRRTYGGYWLDLADAASTRVALSSVFLSWNPFGTGHEAVLQREVEGLNAHLQLDPSDRDEVAARLRDLPEVDEAEYWLPTTRFDVISMIVDFLHARMRDRNEGDVVFERGDYR